MESRFCRLGDKGNASADSGLISEHELNLMSNLQLVNPKAEVMRRSQALAVNVSAAKGLQDVMRTNLGPKGTLKMLVDGAGEIMLTKDGNVLLHQMQIQHPTAIMIARTATAQDDETGDGTTSTVLFIGELLKYAERHISEGVHPRIVSDGFELARLRAVDYLEEVKHTVPEVHNDRDMLLSVARTALRSKLEPGMADQLTDIVTDAVLCIRQDGKPIDLHMVERMHMVHRTDHDSRLVRGLVLDHGSRHPDMPTKVENAYILSCNVSLEYEKTEVSSQFVYSNVEERERLVDAERRFVDDKVRQIIALKRQVCTEENGCNFVVINQKGIDPISLDMMAREGIIGIRRAKRRNMERLALACGGVACNSLDDITADVLGWAGLVYEEILHDEKYTFLEDVRHPGSCTILLKGPNKHTIAQLKDAVRDGLRAVKNTIEDASVLPGGGAFEIMLSDHLHQYAREVSGKVKLGVQAYADALMVVPKVLCENSGFDVSDTILKLQEEYHKTGSPVGVDIVTGGAMIPADTGIWDNVRVKRQFLQLGQVLASQLLLVDEVLRAGRGARNG